MQTVAMSYLPVRNFPVMRIRCGHADCRAVIELPPAAVEAVMKRHKSACPVCGKPFADPSVAGGADVVSQLAQVILALNGLAANVGIELPIGQEANPLYQTGP